MNPLYWLKNWPKLTLNLFRCVFMPKQRVRRVRGDWWEEVGRDQGSQVTATGGAAETGLQGPSF